MTKTYAMQIGALSKHSGVNVETIRYYERIGIMPAPTRSASGYRMYSPDHLKRLMFVRRGRELGFGIDELRDLLRLVDGHTYTCAQIHELTLQHVVSVRRKIADLRRLQRVLDDMAAQCSGDQIPECPIIDTLFDAHLVLRKRRAARA